MAFTASNMARVARVTARCWSGVPGSPLGPAAVGATGLPKSHQSVIVSAHAGWAQSKAVAANPIEIRRMIFLPWHRGVLEYYISKTPSAMIGDAKEMIASCIERIRQD